MTTDKKVKCPKCGLVFWLDKIEEWICLQCGRIYDTEKAMKECNCKNIFRRDKDIALTS